MLFLIVLVVNFKLDQVRTGKWIFQKLLCFQSAYLYNRELNWLQLFILLFGKYLIRPSMKGKSPHK